MINDYVADIILINYHLLIDIKKYINEKRIGFNKISISILINSIQKDLIKRIS
jgi:hypothetical protein